VAVLEAKTPELHRYPCGTAEAVPFRSKVMQHALATLTEQEVYEVDPKRLDIGLTITPRNE
jgi:hypothetical protein